MTFKYFWMFALLSLSYLAQAQNTQITHQSLYWIKANAHFKVTDTWSLGAELEERRFMNPGAQHQVLGTVSATYGPTGKPWKLGAAFCAFFQSPNDPESSNDLIRPEWRPLQYFQISQGNKWIKFNQRLQLEERWLHNFSGNSLTEGYWFSLRFRYRMGVDITLLRKGDATKLKWYVALEPHLQAGRQVSQQVFDQLRTTTGLVYSPLKDMSISLGYLHWYQQLGREAFVSRHILTTGIAYTFDLRKKEQ